MNRDVEAFTRDAALKGIDVAPLRTAADFHAELNRELVVNPWTSQSRWRKARWHNRFAVALLMVCSMLFGAVVYFASDAHADVSDEYAATVCNIIAIGGGTADTVLRIIERTAEYGYSAQQAVDAVDAAVIAMCPEYRGALDNYARKYGAVVA